MRRLTVLVLAFGLLLAAPVGATSVIELDLPAHVAESTAVVEATVGVPYVTINDANGHPMTHTPLVVTAVLAGAAPERIEITQHKGRVGDRELHLPGDGLLEPGSTVVVFAMHAEGRWWLTALAQSVWSIDGTDAAATATRQLSSLSFFERDPATGKVVPAHGAVPTRTTLAALRQSITAAAGN